MIWVWAMGQAFFSLSVTGSGMIVYGAYLSKDEDVVDVAQHTALFDTIAAVVAALVIIPACFSYGQDVGAGPGLLFVTLPTILQDIPLGRLFAVILYVAMIFAGVSSLQNMFEAVAESLQHKFPKLSRVAVLGILCVLCLGFGLLMEPISKWGPWMDFVSIYIIPIGATLGAISWFYVMKKDDLLDAVNTGSRRHRGAVWYSVGRYVYVPAGARAVLRGAVHERVVLSRYPSEFPPEGVQTASPSDSISRLFSCRKQAAFRGYFLPEKEFCPRLRWDRRQTRCCGLRGENAALRGGEGWKEDKMPGWMAMGCFAPQGRIANCQDA